MKIPEKFKSRKLWLAIAAALVVFLNNAFDLNLKLEEVLAIVGSLLSFVVVQGAIDVKTQDVKNQKPRKK